MTLGEYLRSERELRGITLEQVASATKVGIRTLHALEADQYSDLPAKPYIRGFVSSYCSFMGLDPSEVRAQYDAFIDQKSAERPNREGGHSGYAFEKKDGQQQSRVFLFITMCIFLVVGGIAVVFFKPALKHHRSSHLEKLKQVQGQEGVIEQVQVVGALSPSSSPSPGVSSQASLLSGEGKPLPSPLAAPLLESSSQHPLQGSLSHFRSSEQADVGSAAPSVGPLPIVSIPTSDAQAPVAVPSQSPLPQSMEPSSHEVLGPTPIPSVGVNPHDPLDSGHEVPWVEVKQHLHVRVFRDVWVRYRVDDRPTRKFVIRAGKSLVLRARDRIVFQISDPASATVIYNQKGASELISQSSRMRIIQGEATLIYSGGPVPSLAEILQDHRPLLKTVEPKR